MGRPSVGYYTAAGERVPSVTEVLGKFKNPEPLIGWAFKKGYASGMAAAKGLPAPRSAYAEKEEAAQAGTIAHDMLECHILGKEYEYDGKRPPPGVMERAVNGFVQGKAWLRDSALEVVDTEKTLVSEKYKFGGTRDALLKDKHGQLRIGDWKTSAKIYADYLVQVAAYGILAEECEGIKISGYDILRFSKEESDFEHKYFQDLNDAKNAFVLMVRCLPFINRLEDRVA